ncbi:MAG TPA: hypothetical protein DD490_30025 [Acidobacteria bacterium]|nr:hypothetical protein [Acidobacteriota bacterium]
MERVGHRDDERIRYWFAGRRIATLETEECRSVAREVESAQHAKAGVTRLWEIVDVCKGRTEADRETRVGCEVLGEPVFCPAKRVADVKRAE